MRQIPNKPVRTRQFREPESPQKLQIALVALLVSGTFSSTSFGASPLKCEALLIPPYVKRLTYAPANPKAEPVPKQGQDELLDAHLEKRLKPRYALKAMPLMSEQAIAQRAARAWLHLSLHRYVSDIIISKVPITKKVLDEYKALAGLPASAKIEAEPEALSNIQENHYAVVSDFLATVEQELNQIVYGRQEEIREIMSAFERIALSPELVDKPFVIDLFSIPGEAKSKLMAEITSRLGLGSRSIIEELKPNQVWPNFNGLETLCDFDTRTKQHFGKSPIAIYAVDEWGNLMKQKDIEEHDKKADENLAQHKKQEADNKALALEKGLNYQREGFYGDEKLGDVRKNGIARLDGMLGNGVVKLSPQYTAQSYVAFLFEMVQKIKQSEESITETQKQLKAANDMITKLRLDLQKDPVVGEAGRPSKEEIEAKIAEQGNFAKHYQSVIEEAQRTIKRETGRFEETAQDFASLYKNFIQAYMKGGVSKLFEQFMKEPGETKDGLIQATRASAGLQITRSYKGTVLFVLGNAKKAQAEHMAMHDGTVTNLDDADTFARTATIAMSDANVQRDLWFDIFGNTMDSTMSRWGVSNWKLMKVRDRKGWEEFIDAEFANYSKSFYNTTVINGFKPVEIVVDNTVRELLLKEGVKARAGTRSFINARNELTAPFASSLNSTIFGLLRKGVPIQKAVWKYESEGRKFIVQFFDADGKPIQDIKSLEATVRELGTIQPRFEVISKPEKKRIFENIATKLVFGMVQWKTLPKTFRIVPEADKVGTDLAKFWEVGAGSDQTNSDRLEQVKMGVAALLSDRKHTEQLGWKAHSVPFIHETLGIIVSDLAARERDPDNASEFAGTVEERLKAPRKYGYPTDIPDNILVELIKAFHVNEKKDGKLDYSAVLAILEDEVETVLQANAELIQQLAGHFEKKYDTFLASKLTKEPVVSSEEVLTFVKHWEVRNQLNKQIATNLTKSRLETGMSKWEYAKYKAAQLASNELLKLKARIARVTPLFKTLQIQMAAEENRQQHLLLPSRLDLGAKAGSVPSKYPDAVATSWLDQPPALLPEDSVSARLKGKLKNFWLKSQAIYFGTVRPQLKTTTGQIKSKIESIRRGGD